MKANVIRLFEHVKLLQRGVELFQKQKGESCESLRNGFNDENVRIGLLGATSAGKTTLIRRLLSESAGKISSKPETACLVVHSFSKSENLKLEFRPIVKFEDESTGREFNQFLKDYKLADFYEKKGMSEWRLNEGITEETREYDREDIFSFFEQVNKFGEVFSKITWNHRQRRSDYNLTDLIDIYDLPGFGGKEEHDKAASAIFKKERFDVLIYLIDTSCGIPSKEEMGYLAAVQEYLESNPDTSFYWAYEKPSPDEIDIEAMTSQINDAANESGLRQLVDSAKGLLDFTGPIDGDDDELRSRLLVNVLKPYFVNIGRKYRDDICAVFHSSPDEHGDLLENVFLVGNSWPLIKSTLGKLEAMAKEKMEIGDEISKEKARTCILASLLCEGEVKNDMKADSSSGARRWNIFSKALKRDSHRQTPFETQVLQEDDCASDRDYAIACVRNRIESCVETMLSGIFNLRGKMSLTALASFKRSVYLRERDLHMLLFDLQMYWMLKDPDGVSGFIKRPMTNSLYENIDNEVKAIEEFSIDDD